LLIASIGIPIFAGYVFGIWSISSRNAAKADPEILSYAAVSLAMLLSALAIPADITPRYLVPALPAIAVVAVFGISKALLVIPTNGSHAGWVRAVLLICFMALSSADTFKLPHVEPFGVANVVKIIEERNSPNPFVLVSGSARYEGAVIAAFALAEEVPRHYIVRATKVLASGNFMGSNYATRFATPQAMGDWIRSRQIGFITICEDQEAKAFAHNQTLHAVIADNKDLFRMLWSSKDQTRRVEVYALRAADTRPSHDDPLFSDVQLSAPH
jgi:hypothetical protein